MNRAAQSSGFTLIEIILTLVLLGVMGVLVVSFYQAGVANSPNLVQRSSAAAALQETMENVIARYHQLACDNTSAIPPNNSPVPVDADGNYIHRSCLFGPLPGDIYEFPESQTNKLNTFRTELGNIAQFSPAGYTISADLTPISRLGLSTTPNLDVLTDRNQSFMLTLSEPNGGTLSYIFVTGGNFPAFLPN